MSLQFAPLERSFEKNHAVLTLHDVLLLPGCGCTHDTSTAIDGALLIRLSESKTRLVASESSLYRFCSIGVNLTGYFWVPIYISKSVYLALGLGCERVLLCLIKLCFTLATIVWGWKSTAVYQTGRGLRSMTLLRCIMGGVECSFIRAWPTPGNKSHHICVFYALAFDCSFFIRLLRVQYSITGALFHTRVMQTINDLNRNLKLQKKMKWWHETQLENYYYEYKY